MIDLRADGTIGIEFETGTVVVRRPKFGQYKRMKHEATKIGRLVLELRKRGVENPEMSDEEQDEIIAQSDDAVEAWWKLVLLGDDTFVPFVDGPVPPDPNDWPSFLMYGPGMIQTVLSHWREVPLARGGLPVSEPTMSLDLSEELSSTTSPSSTVPAL